MSNEDVLNDMLRKTFPNTIFIRSINERNKTQAIHFSEEWLEAEYKAESEDLGDYPDTIPNQFDNMTGGMNL